MLFFERLTERSRFMVYEMMLKIFLAVKSHKNFIISLTESDEFDFSMETFFPSEEHFLPK